MKRALTITLILMAASLHAAQLTMSREPRWQGRALTLQEPSLINQAGNHLSVTRLAMLVSHPQLQRVDGTWLRARD